MAYNLLMNKEKAKEREDEGPVQIALNRRARFDYFIEDRYEAGLVLQGWEVKSLREGRAQVADAYVKVIDEEAFLVGAHFLPPSGASTHIHPDPTRTRKLLLNRRELDRFAGAVQQKGYTCVATALYWSQHRVKCEIALAKGKADYDKRETEKTRDWQRQKQRMMRHSA